MTPAVVLRDAFDALVERFGGSEYQQVLARARQEFDGRRGQVFEDEALWENWTQGFLEWFMVERVLAPHTHAPVCVAYGDEPDEILRGAYRAWMTTQHSLFEVEASRNDGLDVLDLIGGARFTVTETRRLDGVEVGDIAELRLVGYCDHVYFGRTFCFHPRVANRQLSALVTEQDRQKRARVDIVDHVAAMRVRCERYRHVSPQRIYAGMIGG